jgi:hypothetical protein
MLLKLKKSIFENILPDENGDIFRVYGVVDDIREYVIGSKKSNLNKSCFRNKFLKKKHIFLKIDEIEYKVFFGKKEHEYKMLKVLCEEDVFWVFDHNFEEI